MHHGASCWVSVLGGVPCMQHIWFDSANNLWQHQRLMWQKESQGSVQEMEKSSCVRFYILPFCALSQERINVIIPEAATRQNGKRTVRAASHQSPHDTSAAAWGAVCRLKNSSLGFLPTILLQCFTQPATCAQHKKSQRNLVFSTHNFTDYSTFCILNITCMFMHTWGLRCNEQRWLMLYSIALNWLRPTTQQQ